MPDLNDTASIINPCDVLSGDVVKIYYQSRNGDQCSFSTKVDSVLICIDKKIAIIAIWYFGRICLLNIEEDGLAAVNFSGENGDRLEVSSIVVFTNGKNCHVKIKKN